MDINNISSVGGDGYTGEHAGHDGASAGVLPMMAMKEIPRPNANAQQITALVKESGRVTGYQLANGQILSKEEGVALARQSGIMGVGISSRNGKEYLKSLPDDTESNNLNNLPSITQEANGNSTR